MGESIIQDRRDRLMVHHAVGYCLYVAVQGSKCTLKAERFGYMFLLIIYNEIDKLARLCYNSDQLEPATASR